MAISDWEKRIHFLSKRHKMGLRKLLESNKPETQPVSGRERSLCTLYDEMHASLAEIEEDLEGRILPLYPSHVPVVLDYKGVLTKVRNKGELDDLSGFLEDGSSIGSASSLLKSIKRSNPDDFRRQQTWYGGEGWTIYPFLNAYLSCNVFLRKNSLVVGALFRLAIEEASIGGGAAVWNYVVFYAKKLGKEDYAKRLLQYCERPEKESFVDKEAQLTEEYRAWDPERVKVKVELKFENYSSELVQMEPTAEQFFDEMASRFSSVVRHFSFQRLCNATGYSRSERYLVEKHGYFSEGNPPQELKEDIEKILSKGAEGAARVAPEDFLLIPANSIHSYFGMDKKVFVVLASEVGDVLRNNMVQRSTEKGNRWFMPRLYIDRLKGAEGFSELKTTYETLAKE